MAESKLLRVGDVMNAVLMHADTSEHLLYITELMVENNAKAVIIREGGIPVGIVTARDVINSLIRTGKDAKEISAKEAMTSPLIAVDHDADIFTARKLMLDAGVDKLPVKKDLDVIGLLVPDDIIRDLSWYTG